jgi:hypothetical protein
MRSRASGRADRGCGTAGDTHIYENPGVLPRFFLVNRVRRAASMDAALAMLRSRDFDARNEAVVEGPVEFESTAPRKACGAYSNMARGSSCWKRHAGAGIPGHVGNGVSGLACVGGWTAARAR